MYFLFEIVMAMAYLYVAGWVLYIFLATFFALFGSKPKSYQGPVYPMKGLSDEHIY